MKKREPTKDDLIDVMEMTEKIMDFVENLKEDNDVHLCISAVMSSSVKFILNQCKNIDHMKAYRTMLFDFFDHCIKNSKELDFENLRDILNN